MSSLSDQVILPPSSKEKLLVDILEIDEDDEEHETPKDDTEHDHELEEEEEEEDDDDDDEEISDLEKDILSDLQKEQEERETEKTKARSWSTLALYALGTVILAILLIFIIMKWRK